MNSTVGFVFESDAACCAECGHAIKGAVIDGTEFPGGWHCDMNDVLGTHWTARNTDEAICRDKELWEWVWREGPDE